MDLLILYTLRLVTLAAAVSFVWLIAYVVVNEKDNNINTYGGFFRYAIFLAVMFSMGYMLVHG